MTDAEMFLIDGMTWSFSRINSYSNCPYGWYLNYIECMPKKSSFFSEYGTLMHKLLEGYAKQEIDVFEIADIYKDSYDAEVATEAPYNKYVDLRESYFQKGLDYLNSFDLELDKYNVLGVEKEVRFNLDGYDIVGYIDLLLRDKETGEITILDHKSADIKILKSGKVSKTDADHFDEFKKQLYLYSHAVLEEYGRVDYLCWNLFKSQNSIKIPWVKEEYNESLKWAVDTINNIKQDMLWLPKQSFYFCQNICDQRDNCEYKE